VNGGNGSRLVCWQTGARPLLAYRAGTRAERLRALDLFPAPTLRRRFLAAGIRTAVRSGLDGRIGGGPCPAGEPLSADERRELLAAAGAEGADWLQLWPARPERRRVYLVFREPSGTVGVVKIGAGDFNARQLRNEADALRRLDAAGLHPFRVPTVLFEGAVGLRGDRLALGLGGFPARLQPLAAIEAASGAARVRERLAALSGPGPEVWVHGDLGPGNMMQDDEGGLFVFDWENAAVDAPARVDEVGFWLARRQRRALRDPRRTAAALRRTFRDVSTEELVSALEWLRARDNLAAANVLEAWS